MNPLFEDEHSYGLDELYISSSYFVMALLALATEDWFISCTLRQKGSYSEVCNSYLLPSGDHPHIYICVGVSKHLSNLSINVITYSHALNITYRELKFYVAIGQLCSKHIGCISGYYKEFNSLLKWNY